MSYVEVLLKDFKNEILYTNNEARYRISYVEGRITYIVFRISYFVNTESKTIYDMRTTIYDYSFFFSITQKRSIPRTHITAITTQWLTPKTWGRVILP